MAEIGMGEAAERMGLGSPWAARRALTRAGYTLREINRRTLVVDEVDVEHYVELYGKAKGRGRPRKTQPATTRPEEPAA